MRGWQAMVRRSAIGLAAAVVALLAPAAAQAGTISGGTPFSPLLSYFNDGDTGETVTVTSNAGKIRFEATGGTTITNGAPLACTKIGLDEVYECELNVPLPPMIPTTQLQFVMGDGADTLSVSHPLPAPLVVGGGGADRLTGDTGFQQLLGGAGDDTLISTGGDVMQGEAGTDTVDLSARATPIVIGQPGATDTVATVERIIGGSANDSFRGAATGEAFEGGAGIDTVTYSDRTAEQPVAADPDGVADDGALGEGDDIGVDVENITGGAGNDVIGGGPGTNVLSGAGGTDTASYAGRPGGVTANLDNLANDGAVGENDRLSGFESLAGGEGPDFLTGSSGPNVLSGRGGNDVIDAADGADSLAGGAGDDRLTGGSGVDGYSGGDGSDAVTSFDGLGENVDCGAGGDRATVDVADRLVACETVTRVDEVLDADRDGSIVPQDCDDSNPAIHPGARDVPRNGVDEDCSGADARRRRVRSTVQNQWAFNDVFTRATKFTVRNVPAGGVVRLKCRARVRGGCPFKSRRRESVAGAERMKLLRLFKRRRLPVGTVIEVRITRSGLIGRVVRFKTRAGKVPRATTLCLRPGATRPGRC